MNQELEKRGHHFARYADDFIIMVKSMVKSPRAGERVLSSLTRFIENELKLKVNTEKSQVVKSTHCKFLGFSLRGKQIRWHPRSMIAPVKADVVVQNPMGSMLHWD